ncbi:MAG: DUF1214 domain-containing protein [Kitasatospora sp.]|jgi:hypothetical protein|nr:DUF1214 domain-containing protein [Kitasatospora sp.]
MLHDYVTPGERIVACPNQDVVYGFGIIDAERGPSVVQVPDFGDRFWVYQGVDQRTDSFVRMGAMHQTKPGLYLLAPVSWDGAVPDGIAGVFRFGTRIAVCIPRVFMDDTSDDRAAIQPLINQVMVYPLSEYTGVMRSTDWVAAPSFPAAGSTSGEQETQWVDPGRFFDQLPEVIAEVPARPGEEALYGWLDSLLRTAAGDARVAQQLRAAAEVADGGLVAELFQFRNIGLPLAGHWSTQRNGARFGADYLSRTAMGKANIFVNTPEETAYFYQDLDEHGQRLHGSRAYAVTFPPHDQPPVRGFWSLTLYNEHHFFHPNELGRYSLGTKNKDLHHAADGSLTLTASATPPDDDELRSNWLPAPAGPFSLYLRAYWPEPQILDGRWIPPAVRRFG